MQYSEVFDSYTKCETSKGTCGVLVFVEFVCGGGGGGGVVGGRAVQNSNAGYYSSDDSHKLSNSSSRVCIRLCKHLYPFFFSIILNIILGKRANTSMYLISTFIIDPSSK